MHVADDIGAANGELDYYKGYWYRAMGAMAGTGGGRHAMEVDGRLIV